VAIEYHFSLPLLLISVNFVCSSVAESFRVHSRAWQVFFSNSHANHVVSSRSVICLLSFCTLELLLIVKTFFLNNLKFFAAQCLQIMLSRYFDCSNYDLFIKTNKIVTCYLDWWFLWRLCIGIILYPETLWRRSRINSDSLWNNSRQVIIDTKLDMVDGCT